MIEVATITHDIRLGDCLGPDGLRLLPDRSIDHTITDPPYSERTHRNFGTERRGDGHGHGRVKRDELDFGSITRAQQFDLARAIVRVTRGWIVIFTDDLGVYPWALALTRAGAEYVVKGTYVKTSPMPQMSGDRPAYGTEEIVIAHAPRTIRKRWNGGGHSATYYGDPNNERDRRFPHPTQKPLALMEKIVRHYTNPGELVLDPYAGSGSTLVACKRLGRRAIGWEIGPAYHAIALQRIERAHEQLGLWPGGS